MAASLSDIECGSWWCDDTYKRTETQSKKLIQREEKKEAWISQWKSAEKYQKFGENRDRFEYP